MEVVSTISSVASIASLVSQSLHGLNNLYNLFKDCRDASKTAERFLNEIIKLKETLEEVGKLIDRIRNVCSYPPTSTLASLTIHLEDCGKDVARWLITARQHPTPGDSTAKNAFKKFLLGIKIKSVKDIFHEISRHRDSLALSLSATGRALDIETLQKSASLITKVDEVTSYSKITVEALSRLENCFTKAPNHNVDSRSSSTSLGDIASQLSRIESLLSSGYTPTSNNVSTSERGLSDSDDGRSSGLPQGTLRTVDEHSHHYTSNPNTLTDFLTGYSNPHSRVQILAGFVGQGRMDSIRQFRCLCCANKQNTFPSMNALKQHESERPFGCLYCSLKFRSKGEIESHMFKFHYQFASWSCVNLVDWQAAFYKSTEKCGDRCAYCGHDFPRSGPGVLTEEDSIIREKHLQQQHMYKECDITGMKRHFSPYEFRHHLKQCHRATGGDWMDFLLDACMIDESTQRHKILLSDFELHSDNQDALSRDIIQAVVPPGEMTHELVPKYGGVLVGLDSEHCPQGLMDYLITTNRAQKLNSDRSLVLALIGRVDRSKCPSVYNELLIASTKIDNHLGFLEKSLVRSKQACWNLGFDLSSFDQNLSANTTTSASFANSELEKGEQEQCEHFLNTWQDILHERVVRNWGTSNDRINSWLLQNLAASQEEQKTHRSYLCNGKDLDENEWARLVLKYWLIDEAAVGNEEEPCSTNGAVDSSGICHSTRVVLNTMPVRKRKSVDDSSLPEGGAIKKPKIH